jgi:hypothetical protein
MAEKEEGRRFLGGLWILIAMVVCPFYVQSGSTGLLG